MLRSTLTYAPAVLMPRIAALVSLIVMTRLLTQAEYGLLVLTVTIGEMADTGLSSWIRIALLRLGSSAQMTTGAISLVAQVSSVTGVAAMTAAAIGAVFLVPEHPLNFALATAVYIANNSLNRVSLGVLQIQERRSLFSLLESCRSVGLVVAPVLGVTLIAPTFLVASLAASLTTGLFGMLALRLGAVRCESGPARFTAEDLYRFAGPLILLSILSYGIGSVERILLKTLQDAAAVGLYAASYALARQPLDAIGNAVNLQGFPSIVTAYDRDGPQCAGRVLARQIELLTKLALPCAGLLVILRGEIADLLLPAGYRADAQSIIPIVTLGAILLQLKVFGFDNVFLAAKRNWLQSWSLAPAFAMAIAMGLILIPMFGPLGAAVTFAASTFTGVFSSAMLGRKLVPVALSWWEIGKAVVAAVLTMAGAKIALAAVPTLPLHGSLFVGALAGGGIFLLSNAALHWHSGLLRHFRRTG